MRKKIITSWLNLILKIHNILVLALYKSVAKIDETELHNHLDGLSNDHLANIFKRFRNNEVHITEITDLQEAKDKIKILEEKLADLEARLHTRLSKNYPVVKFLNYKNRKRVLITGGAGFVGSHLLDRLMIAGHEVIVVDNFFTGRKRNIEHWIGHENFEMVHHDIVRPLYVEVDEIYHLASPASPPHYMLNPVKTIKTNTLGTINMLGMW